MASNSAVLAANPPDKSIAIRPGVVFNFYKKFGRRSHVYMLQRDGQAEEVLGVTKALGVLDKPALFWWGINETLAYVESKLQPGQALDEIQIKQLLGEAKMAHKTSSSTGKDIGSLVHGKLEDHIRHCLDFRSPRPELPEHPGARAAFERFLEWEEQNKIKWLATEILLYSSKYGYGGQTDAIARINGKLTLLDLKTTNTNKATGSGVYAEHWLQLAAYQQAYKELGSPHGAIQQRMVLRIGKTPEADGSIALEPVVKPGAAEFRADLEAFLGLLPVYRRLAVLSAKAED